MITDGVKNLDKEEEVQVLDLAELLVQSIPASASKAASNVEAQG
jgi:hypothetical protein